MSPEVRFDARALPRCATGKGSTTYNGVALFVLIEAIVVLSLITSYFYLGALRGQAFPHGAGDPPDPTLAAITLGIVALTALAVWLSERAARVERTLAMRGLIVISIALGIAYAVLSGIDLSRAPHSWTSHAYGSIVWTTSGYQIMHVLIATGASVLSLGLSFGRALTGERRAPIQALSLYWRFVLVSGAAVFFTLYVTPYLM
ncbi:MAG: cytochrome c oxidase subunit 3 [Myxococcota bacterium]|nr:cytochrome c oxidase subunit 3 [Myxococcota bacterium]